MFKAWEIFSRWRWDETAVSPVPVSAAAVCLSLVLTWAPGLVYCYCDAALKCLCWTLLTEVSAVVAGWPRTAGSVRNVGRHPCEGCQLHSDSTLSGINLCRGLPFHHIALFIRHFHCLSHGCFPHFSPAPLNAESILLCLPVKTTVLAAICGVQSEEDREA